MKINKLIFPVLFAGVLVINTLVLSTTNNNDLQLNSLFTLASAQAEDGEEGEGYQTDYKIKTSCSCYKIVNGKINPALWECMSITECEAYDWCPPMIKQNCTTTKCPAGTKCKE